VIELEKLTERQRRFVDEYLKCVNASQAARAAGYAAASANVTGAKLLANSNISQEVQRRLEEIRTQRTADLSECLQFASSVMRGEITEKIALPINGRNSKVEIIEVPARIKERLKACEFLLRVHRAFDKVDESQRVPDTIRIICADHSKGVDETYEN
jgi:phage terminase small subunit